MAGKASQQTGISSGVLKKLLPLVATMAMGSLSQQIRQPNIQKQLANLAIQKMLGNKGQSASGLSGLLSGLLSGQARQQRQAEMQRQQGVGILGKMLDADGDGNMMDDILNIAMKAATKR